MHILLLGATGRVGSHILNYSLKDGHLVTALVRDSGKIQLENERLNVIEGNVLNAPVLLQAVHGADIVISALGTDQSTTLTDVAPLIISAMDKEGVKRIITVGTAGILNSRTQPDILRYQSGESKRKLTRAAEEHENFYRSLKGSSLDWTIVCPTYLPDEPPVGHYRTEREYLPENGTKISVQDTASFVYSLIDSDEYIKTRVGIAY